MMVQHNIKLEEEDKEKIKEIAKIESDKHKMNISPSQITQKAIKEFIEKWESENSEG